ncbi:MAG: deoxyribose-phosphate aldolase [Lachnospiraceae bacterium]|nr:deoxyribose-phosphate aldolase [Lachnospiraceae bacterium]MBP5746393.1 deoxyribose-phosphate aldolase [Lachnospiraceae bacterium]
MTNFEIAAYIDHTLLKPTATWQQIEALCNEAIEYKTASVCIPPNYIARVKEKYGDDLKIATVIGFPLGYETTAAKAEETATALDDGADEIDMVINITDVKNSDYDLVKEEIASLKAICGDKILKVIVETCYLTTEEKINMCRIVTEAGADYIKTSTGFGTAGATLEDVKLFKEHIGENVKIKAAGGIRTREDMIAYIKEGVSRIGCSSTKVLFEE